MLLSARRSYLRYMLICALLIVVYISLQQWDQPVNRTPSGAGIVSGNKGSNLAENEATEGLKKEQNQQQELKKEEQKQKQEQQQKEFEKEEEVRKEQAKMEESAKQAKPDGAAGSDWSSVKASHYREIFEIYRKHAPDVKNLENYKDGKKAGKKAFDQKEPVFSNKELGEFLQVDAGDLEKLKKSHQETVKGLPSTYPEGLYEGTGIVTVAGGMLFPVLVTTLKRLRRVSPSIPVEVFMADQDEYEPEICEQVLPSLNAKCILLKDVYGEDLWKQFEFRSYQLKVLSMLASSFEDNLFLDADSIPLLDVELLFEQEPYKSNGFVIWPDFWYRTTSPHFYSIAGITLGDRVRGDLSVTDPDKIPQADLKGALPDKSTESGQILFNKKQHYKALLLSTYYNLNGFSVFYPLLSQGSGGEGDKETFIAALEVVGDKYYQVQADLRAAGYFENNEFHGTGMLQANPYDDYKRNTLKSTTATERIQFMHLNYPKVNPRDLFVSEIFGKLYTKDENRIRFYGKPSGNYWVFDYTDIELDLWQDHEWLACELGVKQGMTFKDWDTHGINATWLCEGTKKHVAWLHKTHNT